RAPGSSSRRSKGSTRKALRRCWAQTAWGLRLPDDPAGRAAGHREEARSRQRVTCGPRVGMMCSSRSAGQPFGGVFMTEVHHGLEGVVAFETQIAEPDKEGSALRYRGVDIEEIVGRVPFEKVWGLLIDGEYEPGLPPAEPFNIPIH